MIEALVISRLLRWAKWKFKNNEAAGYASQVNFVRLAPSTTHFRDPGIDHECELTDKAYCQLPELHQVVIRVEYLSTARTLTQKANKFGRTRRGYKKCLSEAIIQLGVIVDSLYQQRDKVA